MNDATTENVQNDIVITLGRNDPIFAGCNEDGEKQILVKNVFDGKDVVLKQHAELQKFVVCKYEKEYFLFLKALFKMVAENRLKLEDVFNCEHRDIEFLTAGFVVYSIPECYAKIIEDFKSEVKSNVKAFESGIYAAARYVVEHPWSFVSPSIIKGGFLSLGSSNVIRKWCRFMCDVASKAHPEHPEVQSWYRGVLTIVLVMAALMLRRGSDPRRIYDLFIFRCLEFLPEETRMFPASVLSPLIELKNNSFEYSSVDEEDNDDEEENQGDDDDEEEDETPRYFPSDDRVPVEVCFNAVLTATIYVDVFGDELINCGPTDNVDARDWAESILSEVKLRHVSDDVEGLIRNNIEENDIKVCDYTINSLEVTPDTVEEIERGFRRAERNL